MRVCVLLLTDGRLGIWSLAGALRASVIADKSIVNCVAPHPHLPMFATSGIDSDIKLWGPGAGSTDDDSDGDADEQRGERVGREARWERLVFGLSPTAHSNNPPLRVADDAREAVRRAAKLRADGNACVSRKEYASARHAYAQAEELLHWVPPNTTLRREQRTLLLAIWSNSALCNLTLGAWREAVGQSDRVLSVQPTSAKALFRRASALLELAELDGASRDVKRLLELEPSDQGSVRLSKMIERALTLERRREASTFRRMFASTSMASPEGEHESE
jgi:tetratricopeptide (TPR) repeat protein